MSTADTKAQIEQVIADFQREVPALERLKLVFELELRGRGDIQLFRVEVPGPKITRDIASDAKVRLSIPRTEFNELAKDGTIRHWRECFESGHVKATGPPEILKLISQRRAQAGRAHPHRASSQRRASRQPTSRASAATPGDRPRGRSGPRPAR